MVLSTTTVCYMDNRKDLLLVAEKLRAQADEIWEVAKRTKGREESSRLKQISSQLHSEASKLEK